jgi:Tol biopolymer transport system component
MKKQVRSLFRIAVTSGAFLAILYLVISIGNAEFGKSPTIPNVAPPPPPSNDSPESAMNTTIEVKRLLNPTSSNPLVKITSASDFIDDEIAYCGEIPLKEYPAYQKILSLHRVSKTPDSSFGTSYRFITNLGVVFDPQFSPNKQLVMIKVGWPYERHGQYSIHLLDLRTGKLSRGPSEYDDKGQDFLAYRKAYWSPDSSKIAYIRGGDADGNQYSSNYPLRLYVYDIKSNKDHFIAQGLLVKYVKWTSVNSLMFSTIDQSKHGITNYDKDIFPMRPSIYEVAKMDNKASLVIGNGFDPLPSPDNKRIVFYGWPEDSAAEKKHSLLPKPYIYSRQDSSRVSLPVGVNDKLMWTPDSQYLIVMKVIRSSSKAIAQIDLLNIRTMETKKLCTVAVTDFRAIPRVKTDDPHH